MNKEPICSVFYHLELVQGQLLSRSTSQMYCISKSSLEKNTVFQCFKYFILFTYATWEIIKFIKMKALEPGKDLPKGTYFKYCTYYIIYMCVWSV